MVGVQGLCLGSQSSMWITAGDKRGKTGNLQEADKLMHG